MKNRYSKYIEPISILVDLFSINVIVFFVFDKIHKDIGFYVFLTLTWFVISFFTKYYRVNRFTDFYKLLTLIFSQFSIFTLGYFAYFGVFKEGVVVNQQFPTLLYIFIVTVFFKFILFYSLKWYRKKGMNFRNIVVIGNDDSSREIIKTFKNRLDLGYRYKGFFDNKINSNNDFLGTIDKSFDYIKNNEINEVFCSLASLKKAEIKAINKFASTYDIIVKLIPETTEIYSKNNKAEYFDSVLVLSVKKLPLEVRGNRIIKRIFDIAFSFFVLVFIMSWLTPILGLLIKIESKGSIFFKQLRRGIDGDNFYCYKFRSMKVNSNSNELHTTKNDKRVTKIGSLIRRLSVDEMPQFYNVLKGEMSVVGPRPHMRLQSLKFEEEIDNYIARNAIKPGITGLAQVSGHRGEIKNKSDIQNRVRMDVFYIENWSFLLDIKIIFRTIFNIFKGEDKAY